MTDRGDMASVAASAPMEGDGEALVSVLCVEATYKTQKVFDKALSAAAAGSAAATEELRKLPGMHLCMSPDTPIHAIRAFLQEQEAVALSSSRRHTAADDEEQQKTNSLAHAHFFVIIMPPVSSEGAEAVEAFLPLQDTATLRDVLASGPVLRCADDASADAAEQMLLLVYMRESEYGLDSGDFLLGALCAGLCACCIALCASGVARSADEKRRRRESEQPQQPVYPQQPYYPGNAALPPNPAYYPGNMPPAQGYSYGAPPEYPVAHPAYYNYSGQAPNVQVQPPEGQKQVPGTSTPPNGTGAPAPL